MTNRRYLITFRSGTKFENKFARIVADNKDMAYSLACAKYGFINVSGVYIDNVYNFKMLDIRGMKQL